MKKTALCAWVLVCAWPGLHAQTDSKTDSWWTASAGYFQSEWNKSVATDLYVPVHTWHNRNFYLPDQIEKLNEIPIGLGFGKSYRDEESNWRGFYAMAFADSHQYAEPIIGYFYTKNVWGSVDTPSLGLGYTLFVTAREDSKYLPLLGVAPLVSVAYRQITLNATYLPGTVGVGNIGFFWVVYRFKD